MISNTRTAVAKRRPWAGYVMIALAVLFLLFDSVIHVLKIEPVVESFTQLGYPVSLAVGLGILELVCLIPYALALRHQST